mmetsp:Transcript_15233/g.20115  ORF Transcript_15233/g.20115 Transcript_15233/m.20115 type:complete len:111 (-) Transcript_15233:1062-1394(-)
MISKNLEMYLFFVYQCLHGEERDFLSNIHEDDQSQKEVKVEYLSIPETNGIGPEGQIKNISLNFEKQSATSTWNRTAWNFQRLLSTQSDQPSVLSIDYLRGLLDQGQPKL